MKIEILNKKEKEEVLERLSYLGKLKTENLFIRTSEKIRMFSGHLDKEEIKKIWRSFMIEGIGLYTIKDIVNIKKNIKETRLSLDALHYFKDQIKKSIIEIDEEQKNQWFKGEAIALSEKQKEKIKSEIIALKFKNDFIGTGKIKENKIYNYLPKERRIKN
ncbi:MAG: hypothetical protein QXX68_01915 [Candidatus Pacearchaeota archaeon]